MITDEQLNRLVLIFGAIMMFLIIVYHTISSSTDQEPEETKEE
ncbi:hypothetical protein TPHA_0O01790 [Tetrapisispora phaffii CBS 4417]|uniref:Uncharacterized protein n=1 Tax=Tetrapisispora phaffii (strain ATCC 24235 / CBS 4417 / NBRC 1672 / NRRL Y-8282 / UCD 70-5) TaxID=1071381 RepID=G8C1W8_TETPH|nr:hypothetical protein TPHA_0O01790 [Tetrapisispora phaffii CBS 4417]CCE66146.1 hypothetical protein TPHA_0O01790 [Tetrapisispora phaffii CBS 4417]